MEDDVKEITRNIEQLYQSERGKLALKGLSKFLDGPLALDSRNQAALIALFVSAFGPLCGTTRDLVRDSCDA